MSGRIRTNVNKVIQTLQNDWIPGADLTSYIESAASMVDQIVYRAGLRRRIITRHQAEIVERWLACHMYCMMDKVYASKNTSQASATYQGTTKNFLEATLYGQTAMRLDPTGLLETFGRDERRVASCRWLGRRGNRTGYPTEGYLGDWPDTSDSNPNINGNSNP